YYEFMCYTPRMPRQARIDIPGLLQHVIVRGVSRLPIFYDDYDREDFLGRFNRLLQETTTTCYAWVMLDNHFHLLLQPQGAKLALLMRRLLTGYAVAFNLRHKRAGHLFQNRYKSIVCDRDSYLLELIRYIHLNPIRAGIVGDIDSLATYRWCGHRELLDDSFGGQVSIEAVLPLFANKKQVARQKYLDFLSDGLGHDVTGKFSRGGMLASLTLDSNLNPDDLFDERVLGGGLFVEQVLSDAGLVPETLRITLAKLIDLVADDFGVDQRRLKKPGKERLLSAAKAVICHIGLRDCGFKGVAIAKYLGMTSSAVSHAAKRGEQILLRDDCLQKRLMGRL
ncbi:MAG: transposase, partial [Desulfuromusa sp.]